MRTIHFPDNIHKYYQEHVLSSYLIHYTSPDIVTKNSRFNNESKIVFSEKCSESFISFFHYKINRKLMFAKYKLYLT